MSDRPGERSDQDAFLAHETGDGGTAGSSCTLQTGNVIQATLEVNGTIPGEAPPDDHAALAWISCLCCFWPIAFYAIIMSSKVNERWSAGDFEGAREASETAKTSSLASIVVGSVIITLWVLASS